MLSTQELLDLANTYEDSDPNLSSVIIALASGRLVRETLGTAVAELSLLSYCVENSKLISEMAEELEELLLGKQKPKKPFDPTLN